MRIQPRQQILNVWKALVATCWDGSSWKWDGQVASNSISDSEQLLCLLYPATEIDTFALDNPDSMADDVLAALAPIGDSTQIRGFVLWLLEQYVEKNTKDSGEPDFAAGSYLRAADGEPTPEQYRIEVVDAYSMSLTVCMAGLRFLRAYSERTRSEDLKARIKLLSDQLSVRLTAAMTGLVRSFVVNTVRQKSPEGQAILSMLDQSGPGEDAGLVEGVRRALARVRARLRSDVVLGQEESVKALEDENLLFECGWSWGVVRNATEVDFVEARIGDQPGIADPRPYLYFTIVALDGINDLVAPRTGELGLLNEQQHRLAQALRTRWELTQRYWSTVARFGTGSWPLEDIPWRTSDNEQSDYFSLTVSAVLIQDLVARTATDDDLTRAVAIFDELAGRGRIIRRPTVGDPAIALHNPGVRLRLRGSEQVDNGAILQWEVSDFAAVLLKRMLQAARLSNNVAARDKLMELSKAAMDHLHRRMLRVGAVGLWDDPTRIFGGNGAAPVSEPSWYMTERIIECMVAAEQTYRQSPPNWPELQAVARVMLNTAEHRFDQELLGASVLDASSNRETLEEVERNIDEARQQIREDAATTLVHTLDALRELYKLAAARNDATRSP
ncbi:SCO2524 family protein [Nocardia sp. NPDC050713]|uniref:SCO2524 family protein n=1 Tax=unclassified Nocardia TaxID=2637762 RepID=UPI0033A87E2C